MTKPLLGSAVVGLAATLLMDQASTALYDQRARARKAAPHR